MVEFYDADVSGIIHNQHHAAAWPRSCRFMPFYTALLSRLGIDAPSDLMSFT
jgi:hypothetical protein